MAIKNTWSFFEYIVFWKFRYATGNGNLPTDHLIRYRLSVIDAWAVVNWNGHVIPAAIRDKAPHEIRKVCQQRYRSLPDDFDRWLPAAGEGRSPAGNMRAWAAASVVCSIEIKESITACRRRWRPWN